MKSNIFTRLAVAMVLTAFLSLSFGADYYVASEMPGTLNVNGADCAVTHTDLQAAIDASSAGDTVWVADGFECGDNYSAVAAPDGGFSRIVITKAITLRSVSGDYSANTKIVGKKDKNGLGPNAVRCVYMDSGASLVGLVLTNGYTGSDDKNYGSGGGVFINGNNNSVSNCLVVNCRAINGGGFSTFGASGNRVDDSVFIHNDGRYGGGIHANQGSKLVVSRCHIEGNSSSSASGGVRRGELYNCTLINNTGINGGGADAVTAYDCIITGNTASSSGGGVTSGTLYRCVIAGNKASNGGGTLGGMSYNCVITNNVATGNGGGIYRGAFYNCVIAENHATGNGGAALNGDFYNCTVYNNSSDSAISGIYSDTLSDWIAFYSSISWGNQDVDDGIDYEYSCSPLASGIGCVRSDPLLIVDEMSGLPVFASGTSPCINVTYSKNSSPPDTDILGNPRLSDTKYDMGAVEFVTEGNDKLIIVGNPFNMGNPSLGYGIHTITGDESFTIELDNADYYESADDVGFRYLPVGYSIYENSANPTLNNDRSGDGTSFEYTHEGWAKLQWNFTRAFVSVKTSCSAGGYIDIVVDNGEMTEGEWVPYNCNITLTAVPDEGMRFVTWSGNTHITDVTELANPVLAWNPTMPRDVHAIFAPTSVATDAFYVSTSGDSHPKYGIGYIDLQDAIDDATEGMTVWIEDGFECTTGSISKSGNTRIVIDKAITVRSVSGTAGSGVKIVGARNSVSGPLGSSAVRCVYLGKDAELIGVILTNGCTSAIDSDTGSGGGVIFRGKDAKVSNCIITGCHAVNGGGAASYGVSGNAITDSFIINNEGKYGGAIQADTAINSITLTRCRIENNTGTGGGGGIHRGIAEYCTLTGNTGQYGGGVGKCSIAYNCIITNNTATGYGGGIFGEGNDRSTCHNSLIMGNRSDSNGGGGYGNVTYYNCTVLSNTAKNSISGIYGSSTTILYNTVSWDNLDSTTLTQTSSYTETTLGRGENNENDPRFAIGDDGLPAAMRPSLLRDGGSTKNAATPEIDLRGNKRVRGGGIDIGAIEMAPPYTKIMLK